MKVLFILKYRTGYGRVTHSSGLKNSAQMVCDMLNSNNVPAKLVQVVDNNDIDREVSRYRPTHVVIEALWVVPAKFDELARRHPHVKWIVRSHSEVTFLATEGVAIEWLTQYVGKRNVVIAANSKKALRELRALIGDTYPKLTDEQVDDKVLYLPNYYPDVACESTYHQEGRFLDIGCFGALRPLKNQLVQALAAMRFAEHRGKVLRFHINNSRPEQGGDTVLKNLRALFNHHRHSLEEHCWLPHREFMTLLRTMDASMCVSLSETFCIVAADSVAANVPLVGSPSIPWLWNGSKADPTSMDEIIEALGTATSYQTRDVALEGNREGLEHYTHKSVHYWLSL